MIISIRGIGWITNREYGCIRTGLRQTSTPGEVFDGLSKKSIFSHPVKNFGRFDDCAKMTCYAVGLALRDAGIEYSPARKQDIGIVGTNAQGSLRSDIGYFRDYLAGGRKLSRANLFIYTLPSSPLGEAAIHFGLLGPLLYVAGEGNALTAVLDAAHEMLLAEETPVMLAGKADEEEAIFFVLEGKPGSGKAVFKGLAEARAVVETTPDVTGVVRKFAPSVFEKGMA